jgi:hypothetical protein
MVVAEQVVEVLGGRKKTEKAILRVPWLLLGQRES